MTTIMRNTPSDYGFPLFRTPIRTPTFASGKTKES